jgi:hypothetical protein
MEEDQIIEAAIQGHASTRDAIRWAMQQEREKCAKVCDKRYMGDNNREDMEAKRCAAAIRASK